jgi:hypothetical protein
MALTNHFNNRNKVTTGAVTETILGTKLINQKTICGYNLA